MFGVSPPLEVGEAIERRKLKKPPSPKENVTVTTSWVHTYFLPCHVI